MLAVIGASSLGDEYDTGLTLNHICHLAPPGPLASDILTLPVTMAALFCIFFGPFISLAEI